MRIEKKLSNLFEEIKGTFEANNIDLDVQVGYLMLMGNVIFIDGTVILHPLPNGLIEVNLLRYDVDPMDPPITQVGIDGRLQLDISAALNLAIHEAESAANLFPLHAGAALSGRDFGTA